MVKPSQRWGNFDVIDDSKFSGGRCRFARNLKKEPNLAAKDVFYCVLLNMYCMFLFQMGKCMLSSYM